MTGRAIKRGTATAEISILAAMESPEIWAPWFRDPATWGPWRTFLKALFGLQMDPAELAFFREATGLDEPPAGGVCEAWLVCGRRAGKSFVLALVACYLAVFREWRQYLSPGEIGTVKIIATDRRQARTIFRYCRALIAEVPALAALIERETDDTILLTTGIAIEIQTASFRSVRGYTVIALLCDELAFWRTDDSANPDDEILAAARPAMATVPGSMILCASSPYARKGALYRAYRRWYGVAGGPLVWQRATRQMNSAVPQSFIDAEIERDAEGASAEYLAQFRTDIEFLFDREVVDGAVVPGRHELPPLSGISYTAACDPSGGSSDSMTLAIAHREDDRVILDLVREVRSPFDPAVAVASFSEVLRQYGISRVTGDRYGGEWPAARFAEHGITYSVAA